MNWGKLMRADFGADLQIKTDYSLKDKLIGYLTLVKPPFVLMTPFNAASAAVLSIGGHFPSWQLCLGGFLTAFLASAGVNIYNRYADKERDKVEWPARSIPSGRINANHVLILILALLAASLVFCWIYFNPLTFWILVGGIVFGSLYSAVLRDKVGYLSLPPIEGLIFLAGWAALSPETILTLTPWVIYLIGLSWQAAHIMGHYLVHVRYDIGGKPIINTPAFFFKPSPQAAALIALTFLVICFSLSIWLIFLTNLHFIYIILVSAVGIYSLVKTWILVKDSTSRDKLHKAWSSLTLLRMVCSIAILLDVLAFSLL
jgi:4-hydroxybenzoate polyprenyltransferase